MAGRRSRLVLLVLGILVLAVRTSDAAERTLRDKFRAIEVEQFAVAEGVQVPAEYLKSIQEETIKQLQKSKSFQEVLRPEERTMSPATAVLRLSGTITRFTPGSRGKRYVGFGMGQAKIFVRISFSDRATGQVLMVEQIQGVLMGGLFGGDSKSVTREFGKTVATNCKVVLEKRLPAPGESAQAVPPIGAETTAAEREKIVLNSKDFEGSEKQLNAAAAKGFHVAEFAITSSSTAELTTQKTAAATPVFTYKIVHARTPGSLQKNLNQAAAEGFRLKPHTLATFGGVIAAIVENPAHTTASKREYRVHLAMRVSSLQKDIQKGQAEGYELTATWEYPGYGHLAILEKEKAESGN